ncbi:MAG: ABC-2 family transporter protein [Pirellulales bacterium]|nr:ABC-2 family transporter protein [Pirellulales bacterium]
MSHYLRVFGTFARNSLVRDLTFRGNFLVQCVSSLAWVLMNFGYFWLIFQYVDSIGRATGWGKMEYFVFLATSLLVNSLVEVVFMPNTQEFSELVRTGGLDFALTKPIDTQFLVSFAKWDWSSAVNFVFGIGLLAFAVPRLSVGVPALAWLLYPVYILCGVALLYSLTIVLAASSVWLGRNQNLYDFWFYITNFSRYPMEIYAGPLGGPLRVVFTYLIPVLIVINVPARLVALPLAPENAWLAGFALLAVVASLAVSRWVFLRALISYRSASS